MRDLMLHHHKSILPVELVSHLRKMAEEAYQWPGNTFQLSRTTSVYTIPHGGKYNKDSDSFTLNAVLGEEAAIQSIQRVLEAPELQIYLPEQVFINLDQAWIRRQFPPHIKKSQGHQWHQDGALGFNFMNPKNDYLNGLLDMMIFWIPLSSCGADAPGLEFIDSRQQSVLGLAALNDATLRAQFSAEQFLKPIAYPGDVLVFGGNVIHRTHKTASMVKYRISLGIRVFSDIPERCNREKHIKWRRN